MRHLASVVFWLALASPAAADDEVAHCSVGEATAEGETHAGAPRVLDVAREVCRGGSRDGQNCDTDAHCPGGTCTPNFTSGLDDGRDLCQYRIFEPGTVCFCEHDVFHPGAASNFTSAAEARAARATFDPRLTFLPVGEEVDEDDPGLPLTVTSIKRSALFGGWFFETGTILQPGVGDYVSRFYEGGDLIATIQVRVLSHESAHDLGPEWTQFGGSVVCKPPVN